MAESGTGSFIPKKVERTPRTRTKRIYLFSYITYTLFFGALVAGGAAYGYGILQDNRLKSAQEQLAQEQSAFNTDDIARLQRLDARLSTANSILEDHVSIASLLTTLERLVAQPVTFGTFTYERTGAGHTITLLSGTDTFDAAMFQRTLLEENELFADVSLDDVSIGENEQQTDSEEGEAQSGSTEERVSVTFTLTANAGAFQYDPAAAAQNTRAAATEDTPAATTTQANAGPAENPGQTSGSI